MMFARTNVGGNPGVEDRTEANSNARLSNLDPSHCKSCMLNGDVIRHIPLKENLNSCQPEQKKKKNQPVVSREKHHT